MSDTGRPSGAIAMAARPPRLELKASTRRSVLTGLGGWALLPANTLAKTDPLALLKAIRQGRPLRQVRRLLEAGADPLACDDDGDTAMHYAAAARDPGYVRLLLDHRVSPDAPNTVTGRPPIVAAMIYQRDRQFTLLLAAGANPGLADRTGNTPLHIAAQINNHRYALALLDAGAPASARNDQGQTFQRYMFMLDQTLLTHDARRARGAVLAWLRRHEVPLEPPP